MDLAELPTPVYDDYFDALRRSPLSAAIRPGLPIETSRGCWWGAQQHCTFCGLNGSGMAFRRRQAEVVLGELEALSDRYDCSSFEAVDNILDMQYFRSLLPRLASEDLDYTLFFEVKANLRREQVELLRDAGVRWIQPGIESLCTDVLRLMRKGATATTNVQLLKWCREFGVHVSWTILFGLPGESMDGYRRLLEWLPLIAHLQPPMGVEPIRVDRFSPYHADPDAFGLRLRPKPAYERVYPLAAVDIEELAYFFDAEGPGAARERPFEVQRLDDELRMWRSAFYSPLPAILCREALGPRHTRVRDHRPCAIAPVHDLTGIHHDVHDLCDAAVTLDTLLHSCQVSAPTLAVVLADLIARRLIVQIDGRYVALAIRGDLPTLPAADSFPGGSVTIQ